MPFKIVCNLPGSWNDKIFNSNLDMGFYMAHVSELICYCPTVLHCLHHILLMCVACRTPVRRPGMEPGSPVVEAQSQPLDCQEGLWTYIFNFLGTYLSNRIARSYVKSVINLINY